MPIHPYLRLATFSYGILGQVDEQPVRAERHPGTAGRAAAGDSGW